MKHRKLIGATHHVLVTEQDRSLKHHKSERVHRNSVHTTYHTITNQLVIQVQVIRKY